MKYGAIDDKQLHIESSSDDVDDHPTHSAAKSYIFIGILTFLHSLLELGLAIWLKLGDVASIGFSYWCDHLRNKTFDGRDRYSFGFARAEILGGAANGVALLSLAFIITLEAIPRFFQPAAAAQSSAVVIIIVASLGIVINLLALLAFYSNPEYHHHMHHHHEHHSQASPLHAVQIRDAFTNPSEHHEGSDMNLKGAFLHFLGDSLSSGCVLGTGVILFLGQNSDMPWLRYVDVTCSLLIVLIIIVTTWPFVKECAMYLMQTVPVHLNMQQLEREIRQVPGVLAAHELHAWALTSSLNVASVHIICDEKADLPLLLDRIRAIFHSHNIHSSAIQPDFVCSAKLPSQTEMAQLQEACDRNCVPSCTGQWCCRRKSSSRLASLQ